ncbi:MAG: TonB-dependent receptor [Deltaproteobacteria bacterium]|nr:TonB-dependent receptor [Deltaproteobacteria bacterium]
MVWQTRADLTSKLLYGLAFRPPSFAELYAQNNPAATGNPDFDPETIDTKLHPKKDREGKRTATRQYTEYSEEQCSVAGNGIDLKAAEIRTRHEDARR